MKRVVWLGRWRARRGGACRGRSEGEEGEEEGGGVGGIGMKFEALKAWKALDWEVRKSERVRWERMVETSLQERMVIVEGEGEAAGGGMEGGAGDGVTSTTFSSFFFDGIADAVGGGVGAPEGGVTVELTCSHSGSDSIVGVEELIVVGCFPSAAPRNRARSR